MIDPKVRLDVAGGSLMQGLGNFLGVQILGKSLRLRISAGLCDRATRLRWASTGRPGLRKPSSIVSILPGESNKATLFI